MASVTDYLSTILPIWGDVSHDLAAIQQGAALLASGAVKATHAGWHVSDGATHLVHYRYPAYRCTCGAADCAHREAVALAVQATLLVARARYSGNLSDLQSHVGRELPAASGHRCHLLKALWAATDRERRHAERVAAHSAEREPVPLPLSTSHEGQLAAEALLAATRPKRELHRAGYHVLTCVLCRTRYARRTKSWAKFLCPRCHTPEMLTEMRRVRTYNRQASERRYGSGVCFLDWLKALRAFGWGCAYCGEAFDGSLTLDHFIPQAAGGATCKTNVVPACESCNCEKNDALPAALSFSKRRVWRVATYLESQADAAPPWPPRRGPARPTDQASGALSMAELTAWMGKTG